MSTNCVNNATMSNEEDEEECMSLNPGTGDNASVGDEVIMKSLQSFRTNRLTNLSGLRLA